LSYDFGRSGVDFCVSGGDMPQFNSSRRKALKRMALLGAESLVPAFSRQSCTHGRSYGRLRLYRSTQRLGLERVICGSCHEGTPHVGVVEAGYLPETTDYGSGKETPETKAYAEQTNYLIEGVIGSIT
jgi:hypothetical protein